MTRINEKPHYRAFDARIEEKSFRFEVSRDTHAVEARDKSFDKPDGSRPQSSGGGLRQDAENLDHLFTAPASIVDVSKRRLKRRRSSNKSNQGSGEPDGTRRTSGCASQPPSSANGRSQSRDGDEHLTCFVRPVKTILDEVWQIETERQPNQTWPIIKKNDNAAQKCGAIDGPPFEDRPSGSSDGVPLADLAGKTEPVETGAEMEIPLDGTIEGEEEMSDSPQVGGSANPEDVGNSDANQAALEARFQALYVSLMEKQVEFKEAVEPFKTDNQNAGKG